MAFPATSTASNNSGPLFRGLFTRRSTGQTHSAALVRLRDSRREIAMERCGPHGVQKTQSDSMVEVVEISRG